MKNTPPNKHTMKMKEQRVEILIYLNLVKKFFSNNETARSNLMVDLDSKYFYEILTQMAEENLEKNGEPQLSHEQFDSIRIKLINNIGGLGKIFLN